MMITAIKTIVETNKWTSLPMRTISTNGSSDSVRTWRHKIGIQGLNNLIGIITRVVVVVQMFRLQKLAWRLSS